MFQFYLPPFIIHFMSSRVRHCVSRLLCTKYWCRYRKRSVQQSWGRKFVAFDQAVLFFNSSQIFFVHLINFTSADFNRWRDVLLFISLCIRFHISLLLSLRSLCSSKRVWSVAANSKQLKTGDEKKK